MLLSISFDIAGLIILSVLLFGSILRKMTSGLANRVFLATVVCEMVASSLEIFAVAMDYSETAPPVMVIISHTLFLIFRNLQAPLQLTFLMCLTESWHLTKQNFVLKLLTNVPATLMLLLLVINSFTGILFTYENGYQHTAGYNILYVLLVPYYVTYLVYLIRFRKQFDAKRIFALATMTTLSFVAIVIHNITPDVRMTGFSVAVAQLIIGSVILRTEEIIDTMTGLHKHDAYAKDLKLGYQNDKHLNVVMLNIGNYEKISEMVGYDGSVELISEIARHIQSITKSLKTECVCYYLQRGRYRVIYDEKDYETAKLAADYILNDVKIRTRVNNLDINLLPYVVLARCPQEIETYNSMMQFGLNFHEKLSYRDSYYTASEVYSNKEFEIRNNINKIISKALAKKSFKVYYQPIYSTETNRFVSAEALLRLFDDKYGFVPPDILVPAAEKSGAIHEIGKFVFEEVCKFVSSEEFKELGLEYIEVNLSVAQCMNSALADDILKIMDKYHVPPERLNLEITETAASFSQRVMLENIDKLSDAGLEFSLDDYGTGYSNMKRMVSLPLKIIKLDKSLVDEHKNQKMWVFLLYTVKMLKDMDMEIVVEGIETEEMVNKFSDLKCDFIQGYYFSKPICKEDFVKFIRNSIERRSENE